MGHGHPDHPRRQQPLQVGQLQRQRGGVDVPELEHRASRLQPGPAADVGLMVAVGDDDLVARPNARQQGAGQLEHQRRGGATHHHLIVVGGIDQRGDRAPSGQHACAGILRLAVAGTELHAAAEQVVAHPVGHSAQHQRAAGVVEVDALALQGWKFGADVVEVQVDRGQAWARVLRCGGWCHTLHHTKPDRIIQCPLRFAAQS